MCSKFMVDRLTTEFQELLPHPRRKHNPNPHLRSTTARSPQSGCTTVELSSFSAAQLLSPCLHSAYADTTPSDAFRGATGLPSTTPENRYRMPARGPAGGTGRIRTASKCTGTQHRAPTASSPQQRSLQSLVGPHPAPDRSPRMHHSFPLVLTVYYRPPRRYCSLPCPR